MAEMQALGLQSETVVGDVTVFYNGIGNNFLCFNIACNVTYVLVLTFEKIFN
jgi:hypothetical protein